MRFLRAVRLDDSDAHLLSEDGAAEEGEWLVSGGYAVCDLARGHRTARCRCDSTFVAAGSARRCTIAEVAEIDEPEYERLKALVADYFLETLGAPSLEVATAAAEDECTYTADLAAGLPPEVWITVKREPSADGVSERYSVFKRLMIGGHKL